MLGSQTPKRERLGMTKILLVSKSRLCGNGFKPICFSVISKILNFECIGFRSFGATMGQKEHSVNVNLPFDMTKLEGRPTAWIEQLWRARGPMLSSIALQEPKGRWGAGGPSMLAPVDVVTWPRPTLRGAYQPRLNDTALPGGAEWRAPARNRGKLGTSKA